MVQEWNEIYSDTIVMQKKNSILYLMNGSNIFKRLVFSRRTRRVKFSQVFKSGLGLLVHVRVTKNTSYFGGKVENAVT